MSEFQVSDFLEQAYEDSLAEAGLEKMMDCLADDGRTPEQRRLLWESFRRERVVKIQEMLGIPRLEKLCRMQMSAGLLEESHPAKGIRVKKYRVDAIKKLPFAVHVVEPDRGDGKQPSKAVIFLCGHDPRGAAGAYLPLKEGDRTLGEELARQGYMVLVPELMGLGEAKRKDAAADLGACESCSQIEPWLLNCGLNLVGVRVLQAMKTLEFAREYLRVKDFAAYGISGGGHVCSYFGVLEERLDAVILSGYCNTYRHSTLAQVHCICNYIPGQIGLGESCHVTMLAAPAKKLLVMNGDKDPIFPIEGSREAFSFLENVYRRLGCGECFESVVFNGGHEIRIPEVCDWLRRSFPV